MSTSVTVPRETMIQLVQAFIAKQKEEDAKRAASYDSDLATWREQIWKECERIALLARDGKLKSERYSSTSFSIHTKSPNPFPVGPKANSDLAKARKHLAMLKASNQTQVTVSDNNDWGQYL